MPRVGLSFAEVAAAFEKLLTQGEQPTAERIHELLGKGTVSGIQKYLTQIFEQSRLDLVTQADDQPKHVDNHNALSGDLLAPPLGQEVEPAPAPVEIPQEEPVKEPTPPQEVPNIEPAVIPTQEPTEIPFENPSENAQGRDGKRNFKRDRFNNNRHSHGSRQSELEEAPIEIPLEDLPDETLVAKIRRLESILLKEQMRREVAERIMMDTQDYADLIKEQVSQRINDFRQNMDVVIEQLQTQLREQKQAFDQDLTYYQEQLSKANEKIASLTK